MDITPTLTQSAQIIQGYGNQGFTIAGNDVVGSVLVFAEETFRWPVTDFSDISKDMLQEVVTRAESLDILLIGCGKTQGFIPPHLRDYLREHHISIDSMDTGAACRTFNILLAEGRRTAAALIAV